MAIYLILAIVLGVYLISTGRLSRHRFPWPAARTEIGYFCIMAGIVLALNAPWFGIGYVVVRALVYLKIAHDEEQERWNLRLMERVVADKTKIGHRNLAPAAMTIEFREGIDTDAEYEVR